MAPTANASETVMLVDGNSLTYRAFFALPTDLATASGQVTNAVFGFTSMLINLARDHQPQKIAVAFDRPEPTFRHDQEPTYKANRDEAPDILRQQMGLVRQVIDALKIPSIEAVGYEADDIIATLASQARDAGKSVLVVTGDRDAYQLVEDPLVRVLYNKRGVSDYALYDEAGIEERTGVRPEKYLEYAALRGDKSDNLPGVPGVGEKTAAKLINKYGDVEGILDHLEDQTPKLRENLETHQDRARRNVELMALVRDVPLELSVDDLQVGAFDGDEVRELFDFLEFRTLYDRLDEAFDGELGAPLADVEVLEAEVAADTDESAAVDLLAALTPSDAPVALAGAWTGEPGRSELVGLAVVVDAAGAEVLWLGPDHLSSAPVLDGLRTLFAASDAGVAAHDAKPLVRSLLDLGVPIANLVIDTKLAAYLLDPADTRYELEEVLAKYTSFSLPDEGAADGQLDLDGDAVPTEKVVARQALAADRLVAPLDEALDAHGLRSLHDDIEVPLVPVLASMEALGVGVDRAVLQELNDRLAAEAEELAAAIRDDAGRDFNVNSTKQLREVLFDELGLTPQKKTKTGYSTDAASLEKLSGEHPIVDHLLRYREVEKLRSTYGEGLLAEVAPDERIHATFNQTVARTGRLSSDAPNLHNIPVRTAEGRAFRSAFVPADGYEFLVADYNQIELRCIAHLAEDPGLIEAFATGADIHTETAARIFATDPDEVNTEQRSKAKMVSYGLAYGMEAYGLAQRLSIPTDEAAEILDAYFEAFPAVRSYMDRTVAEARERGYTETLFGRRRPIPELSAQNYRVRQAGERQAMNAGIQGLAADIFKVALVRLYDVLVDEKMQSRLILQVHDEVILEVPGEERDVAAARTEEVLSSAGELSVPLEIDLAFGATWADAKG